MKTAIPLAVIALMLTNPKECGKTTTKPETMKQCVAKLCQTVDTTTTIHSNNVNTANDLALTSQCRHLAQQACNHARKATRLDERGRPLQARREWLAARAWAGEIAKLPTPQ